MISGQLLSSRLRADKSTIVQKDFYNGYPVEGYPVEIWLFSTLCDNFCLCKVKCLLGKTFRTILKEETISIDLVYTQKPEEPKFCLF
ncbi:hypothetical protein [Microcystis aeruginosa]|uniref:hypothetical protein n=1 Tax=Microcystis aeruginosa TaxID=1126 RepID=UPI0009331F30|nr:hypothetical protein [Microcystis aeruginosa]